MSQSIFKDVKICQMERTEELNRGILARNNPDSKLQMQFDPRFSSYEMCSHAYFRHTLHAFFCSY